MKIKAINFIIESTKGKRFFLLLFFLSVFIGDLIALFFVQYLYKFVVNSIVENKFNLKIGIFYIFILAFLINFQTLELLLKAFFKFKSATYIQKDVRNKLFDYTIQHSISYFNNSFSGALSNKIDTIVRNIREFFTLVLAVMNLILFFIATSMAYFKINWHLSLFFVILTFLYVIIVSKIRQKLIKASVDKAESRNKYFGLINDDFVNVSNIKAFNTEKIEINRVKKQNFEILRKSSRFLRFMSYVGFLNGLFVFLYVAIIMGFSIYLLVNKTINLGDFLFIWSITAIFGSFLRAGVFALTNVFETLGNIQNGIDTLLKPISITNKKDAKDIVITDGRIVLKNVKFSYEREDK